MTVALPKAFDLTGKVAIVTGGGGLLGLEHGLALAEVGASVFLGDVNYPAAEQSSKRISENCGRPCALPLLLDVTNSQSVEAALKAIVDRYGRADILVNNAAIDPKVDSDDVGKSSRLEHLSVERWHAEIGVGLTGAFLCSRTFGRWMADNGGGVILNIASDLSVFSPDQRLYRKDGIPKHLQPVKPVTYSVIKTALLGLTRYLATYWAADGVRVNALSPGGVYTGQPEEFVVRLSQLIPLGRMAKSDEYRSAIQFLCSEASSYMTGQNIIMDGGRSVW